MKYSATHYATLGVPVAATLEQINAAFKRLTLLWHPDKMLQSAAQRRIHARCAFGKPQPDCKVCVHQDVFVGITTAYGVLSNAQQRSKYDALLFLQHLQQCGDCHGRGTIIFRKGFTGAAQAVLCAACNGSGAL